MVLQHNNTYLGADFQLIVLTKYCLLTIVLVLSARAAEINN